ncbi:MAG TPA: biotin/lipoyl-containing protein, partial [Candidatus Sulfotelmatobacter sp.]|nr:biotin/lipoyl-containing protein [Candidatus Sulfotelmatobacter sp.]
VPTAETMLDVANHPGAVKSPMVGIVYVAAEPGAQPFVKSGDAVKAGQTVLIVEAMKTMNPITAPRDGSVKLILVENQQPVEYGQVMMIIE